MSQQPVSFVLHLYWTVTLKWNCSSETYNNLQVKFIYMYLAKSMLVVYFWASLCTLSGLLWYKIVFLIIFFFFPLYPLSVKNLFKYSSPIPRVWLRKTGSTVLGGEMDCKSKFICQRFGQNYPAGVQMEVSLSKVRKF